MKVNKRLFKRDFGNFSIFFYHFNMKMNLLGIASIKNLIWTELSFLSNLKIFYKYNNFTPTSLCKKMITDPDQDWYSLKQRSQTRGPRTSGKIKISKK